MKTIKERLRKEIVKKYKENYFATARKQLLEVQEIQALYNRVLDSNQDLISLVQGLGHVVFFKHVNQIIDDKLYQKLYHQDPKYFLRNLNFISYLLQLQVLPLQHTNILLSGLGQILRQPQNNISAQNTSEVFQIVEKILQTSKYLINSLSTIANQCLILKLYELTIAKEMNQYFFKIIHFSKLINDQKITQLSDQQKLHCLQIHILTSDKIQELYLSYSLLGDIFEKTYNNQQQLFEYGSILDKTMKDILIDRLIDPISYFFMKALKNISLNKLAVEMNFIHVIFNVIIKHLMVKNNISIFGHQSVWYILKMMVSTSIKNKMPEYLYNLDWQNLRLKLDQYHAMKYPYVKNQVIDTLSLLSQTRYKDVFQVKISYSCKKLQQQFEQVQI